MCEQNKLQQPKLFNIPQIQLGAHDMNRKISFIILISLLLSSCGTGRVEYIPPSQPATYKNSVIIKMNKDKLWKKIVPALGKSFFVINNIDKDSGIINVSYSGDPEKYIDCGQIKSYVKNAKGEREYNFPASRANQHYEAWDAARGESLCFIDRKMNLEGRINIIIEEVTSDESKVTVNIKYILTKSTFARNIRGQSRNFHDTISFTSGHGGKFPGPDAYSGTICIPNGKLEHEILELLTSTTT